MRQAVRLAHTPGCVRTAHEITPTLAIRPKLLYNRQHTDTGDTQVRPNTEKLTRHSGTMTGTKVNMTFDENSIAHLMSVLTDLYSDAALAVIREYATNALDSHKAAGNTDPIEVTLPSELEPVFIVQDFGVGLSVDDITNVFAKYGASTKRDNDTEAGMLGLGCKAALTYTDQFTVVGIKGGTKVTAIVARGEDGTGQITIVDTVGTDEPNGVTIKVPVSNVRVFNAKANQFFRWVDEDTVLVNGEATERPEGIWLSDDLLISNHIDNNIVVMGGIGYPVDHAHAFNSPLPWGYYAVKWVPMGAVNFTPSRESLHYTKRTEATLNGLADVIESSLDKVALDDITQAQTAGEAFLRATKWTPLVAKDFDWGGNRIPKRFDLSESVHVYKPDAYRKKATKQKHFSRPDLRDACQVLGYTNKTLSQTNKAKLEKYAEDNGFDHDTFILTDTQVGLPWTENADTIAWDDVAEVEVTIDRSSTTSGRSRKRTPGSYFRYTGRGRGGYEEVETVGDDVIYFSPSSFESPERLARLFPDHDIIKLGKNRWEKFERENEGVQHYRKALKNKQDTFLASLTVADKLAITKRYDSTWDEMVKLRGHVNEIDDPDLRDAIQILKDWNVSGAQQEYIDLRWLTSITVETPQDTIDKVNAAIDKYPLLRYNKDTQHVVDYINWCYGNRKGEE